MPRNVKLQGNLLTLTGRTIKKGTKAPDFKVTSQDIKEINLSDFEGKIKVLASFPSLDTPVCDLEVKEFNKRAAKASPDVVVLGISKDLPFAQKRFCDMNGIENVKVFSDYKTSFFGINYGLLIKEFNLLARAVIILDKINTIRYVQIVDELSTPPDYEDVLSNLDKVVKDPESSSKEELSSRCKPCEGGIAPLSKDTVEKLMAKHRGWELVEGDKLRKEFKFKDFQEAKYFLDLVSIIAEGEGHHPTMTLTYNKLKITLTTHAAGGLTDNDFIMARIIDEISV